MTDYNGYPTRLSFLEARRQEALEVAERTELEHGEADPLAAGWRRSAKRLATVIEWERDWSRRMA